jgi:hypothetical protein
LEGAITNCFGFFWCISFILTLMLFLFGDIKSFVGWCYPPSLTFPLLQN